MNSKFQRDIHLDDDRGSVTVDKTRNVVNFIKADRNKYGIWTFDDEDLGIVGEPFVGEINDMIDACLEGYQECTILCSQFPIPNYNISLTRRDDLGQGMYQMDGTEVVGWLCPCFLSYFPHYVEKVYAKIDPYLHK